MYAFYNSSNEEKSKEIELYVWDDNNGQPGSVLFSNDTTITLAANLARWTSYDISSKKIFTKGPFWIGHREKTGGYPSSLNDSVATAGMNYYSVDGTTWKEEDWDYLQKAVVLYNTPPPAPKNPNPINGSKKQQLTLTLQWDCDEDADGDSIFFDVYLDTKNPPIAKIANRQTDKYTKVNLNYDQNYYWQVITWDEPGDSTHGKVWHFSTLVESFNDISTEINGGAGQNSYRMISVPGELNNPSPEILTGNLGSYDKTKWRFFQDKNNLREYPDTDALLPGKAFWIISRSSNTIHWGSGKYVTMLGDFSVALVSGWNQIGNPFNVTIDWNVIKAANSAAQIQGPYFYDGGYNELRTNFRPFEGCYIFVNNWQTLKIPGNSSTFAKLQKKDEANNLFNGADWYIQIAADCRGLKDNINYFGMSFDAESGFDDFDFLEPPVIGDYLSLYFPHDNWYKFPGRYTTDFRKVTVDGTEWQFEVETSVRAAKVNLTFKNIDDIPFGLAVFMIDKGNGRMVNLRENNKYEFQSSNDAQSRKFSIFIGEEQFVEKMKDNLFATPSDFQLYQNYPNPFNSVTTIKYDISKPSYVKIIIYDLNGKSVSNLFEGYRESGRYSLQWDANLTGSGVYFMKIEAGTFVQVRKLILMK